MSKTLRMSSIMASPEARNIDKTEAQANITQRRPVLVRPNELYGN